MKKILVLLGFVTLTSLSSMAYIQDDKTSDLSLLKLQGYSDSMLQIVDWTKYRNQGPDGKYVRYYRQKQGTTKLGRIYQGAKEYFDPIQDKGQFGDNQIEFSNTWMGNDTWYSSDMEPNRQIESL